MALTQISTAGVKDDAVTAGKIPANAVGSSELADNAVDTAAIADQAVALSKLPHGTSSNDGKFLRANNGADPSFETVSIPAGTTINNNADNRVITGSGTANTLNAESGVIIDANGNVGIGVSSTGYRLHIEGTTTGSRFGVDSSSSGITGLAVTNEVNADLEHVIYDGRASFGSSVNVPICFHTNGKTNEKMRIHTNGRISAGTSTALARLHLKSPDGGNAAIILDQTQDAANYQNSIDFKNAGTQYASITAGKDSSNNSFGIKFTTGASFTEQLRIQAGGGISFNGDTAAANALDDYEEGTYTPTIIGTSSNPTQSYSGQFGHYVKIGKFVFISVDVQLASSGISGGSGEAVLTLPFTRNTGTQNYGTTAGVGYAPSWGAVTPTAAYGNPGTNWMYLMGNDKDTGANFISAGNVSNSTRLIAGFAYMTS